MSNRYKAVGPFGYSIRVIRSWIVETGSGELQLHQKKFAEEYIEALKQKGVPFKVWQQDFVRTKIPGVSITDSEPYRIDITNHLL